MIHAIMPEKNTRIFIIFFRKINKIPEFYTIFARKMPEFYIIIAQKYFSRILGGHVPLCPPPVSYAYDRHENNKQFNHGTNKLMLTTD